MTPGVTKPVVDGVHEALDDNVHRTRIHGGPLVLTEHVDWVRSVAIGIWIPHGTVHEDPARRGACHFLEHAVFKGTPTRTALDIAAEIEGLGGVLDAYTTHEYTAFLTRIPDVHLPSALDVLTDLVFNPELSHDAIELERNVILEEIAGVTDAPEQLVFELQAPLMYGGHPYGEPILGTHETVSGLGAAELREVHTEAYRPSRAIVAAAGRLDHLELVDRLTEILRREARGEDPPVEAVPESEAGLHTVRRPGGRQSHIVAGGLTVPYGDSLRYAVILAETALGAGMSSRLFQRVREELGLAYAVYSFSAFHAAAGHAGAYVGTQPETAEAALDALLGEMRELAEQGLPQQEIDDTKRQLRGQLMVALETPAARMQRLAGIALYQEPYMSLDEIAANIDAVTRDEIDRACALFHPDRLAIMELAPA